MSQLTYPPVQQALEMLKGLSADDETQRKAFVSMAVSEKLATAVWVKLGPVACSWWRWPPQLQLRPEWFLWFLTPRRAQWPSDAQPTNCGLPRSATNRTNYLLRTGQPICSRHFHSFHLTAGLTSYFILHD